MVSCDTATAFIQHKAAKVKTLLWAATAFSQIVYLQKESGDGDADSVKFGSGGEGGGDVGGGEGGAVG